MTCIVGLVDGTSGRVVMGGDSCAFSGWDITPGVVKVFHNGPYLIGTSGDAREGQLLRYALTVPEQPEDMEPQRFMSTMFVDALRACFKDAGYAQKEKEKEEYDGRLLVAYQSHLFAVYGNYAVLEASTGFNAIGVGEDYAKGVLFATTAATLTVEARVLLALQAAEALSAGVRSPFTIEVLEPHVAPSANEAAEDLSALALTPAGPSESAPASPTQAHERTSLRLTDRQRDTTANVFGQAQKTGFRRAQRAHTTRRQRRKESQPSVQSFYQCPRGPRRLRMRLGHR